MVLSSGADSSSVRAISAWPNASRAPQRLIEATQSRASTLLAVVEHQPVAQRELPGLAVVLDDVAGDHLRRGLEAVLLAGLPVQRVEHHVAVVARHVGRGPDRIEDRQVRLRDEFQHPLVLRLRRPRAAPGSRPRPRGKCVSACSVSQVVVVSSLTCRRWWRGSIGFVHLIPEQDASDEVPVRSRSAAVSRSRLLRAGPGADAARRPASCARKLEAFEASGRRHAGRRCATSRICCSPG